MSRKLYRSLEECEFLLLLAKIELQKYLKAEQTELKFVNLNEYLIEAESLASKFNYKPFLAELHLFGANSLSHINNINSEEYSLAGLVKAVHLERCKLNCIDDSKLSDLFYLNGFKNSTIICLNIHLY